MTVLPTVNKPMNKATHTFWQESTHTSGLLNTVTLRSTTEGSGSGVEPDFIATSLTGSHY